MIEQHSDLDAFTKLMGFMLSHVMGAFKMWIWYSKRHKIRNMIELLERGKLFENEKSDNGMLFIIEEAIRSSRKVTWTFFILGTALPINASLAALLTPVNIDVQSNNETLYIRKLPYDSWFPFDAQIMPFYSVSFLYQVYSVFIYALDITSLDTFYVGLIIHTTCLMRILKRTLIQTRKEAEKRKNSNSINANYEINENDLMHGTVRTCAAQHQMIIRLTKQVDEIIKFVLLGQFFATTFILITNLFLLSMNSITSMKFLNELSYLMAVTFQFFIYCWYGNSLTEESSLIRQAIYESGWISSMAKTKSNLMIMMIRTQSPLRLNIGIFAPLTLQTFVTVLRGSYSYFTVLKQMNNPEL